MSMYQAGSERCVLCKKNLRSDEYGVEWGVIPHVIEEMNDRLWKYSSGFCHFGCYDSWEYKEEYEKRIEKFDLKMGREVRSGPQYDTTEIDIEEFENYLEEILGYKPERVAPEDLTEEINSELIEKNWSKNMLPLVNGIVYPSCKVVFVDVRYGESSNLYERENSFVTTVEELDSTGDLGWVYISSLFKKESNEGAFTVSCGEGDMEGDGFVSLYSNVEKRLLWIAFFDNSNPFVEAEVDGSMVRARTNLDYLWSFPIDSPEDFVIEKAKI